MDARAVFSAMAATTTAALVASSAAAQTLFGAAQQYNLDPLGVTPPGIATGDLNRDGIVDLVAAGGGEMLVFAGLADGTLAPPVRYTTGGGSVVFLADTNGDGLLDAIVGPNGIRVLPGRGDGTFEVPIVSPGYLRHGTTADFNADGRIDIASVGDNSNSVVPETVDVYFGKGDGRFGGFHTVVTTDLSPRAVRAVHLDRDGLPDLVFRQAQTRWLSLHLNNGDGTFRPAPGNLQAFTEPSVGDLTVADVDRDGLEDVIVAGGTPTISVFRGKGDGTLEPAQAFAIPNCSSGCGPASIATGDPNADGAVDVVTANGIPGSAAIFINDGAGLFPDPLSLPFGQRATTVAMSDFNRDGRSDLAVAHTDGVPSAPAPFVLSIVPSMPGGSSGGGGGTGQTVGWLGVTNASAHDGALQKTGGCDGCFDASGRSAEVIDTDGFVEFTVPDPGVIVLAGLARVSAAADPADVDFGLLLQGGGWMEVRERGAYRADIAVTAGDTFRVAVDAGTVTYAKNGTVFFTSAAPPPLPLQFIVLLASADSAIEHVAMSGGAPPGFLPVGVNWIDRVNVTVTGTTLAKTAGCAGCFDAAATSEQVLSRSGAFEFVVDDPATVLIAGLTDAFVGTDAAEIAYGLRVQGGGWVEVREHGHYRSDAPVAAGDVLRIAVGGGLVTYSRNGIAFHTSVLASPLPLFAAASFADIGASISGALIDD